MFPRTAIELRVVQVGSCYEDLLRRAFSSIRLLENTLMIARLTTFTRRTILRANALHL